jgi:hypothetical protein
VRQLLNHASDPSSHLSDPGFAQLNRQPPGPSDILRLVSRSLLQFLPGEKSGHAAEKSLASYRDLALADDSAGYEEAM